MDALHLHRVFLAGMSFGGWLALNYAVAVPHRVRRLVLLSPGGLLPMVRQFTVRGLVMVWLPSRLTVRSFFRWLGFSHRVYPNVLELLYLGVKHFRMALETARVMPAVISDEALRGMKVPTLLLIGDHEVISDAARALQRARSLIPRFEGELVPGCRHDMYASRHDIVDARVLEFLKAARPHAIEPAGFLMTRRMLIGVKQRAETLRRISGTHGIDTSEIRRHRTRPQSDTVS